MNEEYTIDSLKSGAGLMRDRWGLIVLLYVVNLGVAFVLALPIYLAVVEHVGFTGFGPDLIERFDLELWRGMLKDLRGTFASIGLQLLWVLPIYAIWKTASHMGVIYALHNGAIWPFWRGVGYYTGRGLLIGVVFLPLKILWSVFSFFIAGLLSSAWQGEVGTFWVMLVLLPVLLLTGLAVLDLFQRYARMALVIRHDSVAQAIASGVSWPIKYGAASYLYLIWYFIALLAMFATIGLNAMLHVGTRAVLIAFLIQQASMFTRSAIAVGWIGSEVSLFERTHINELPLIADVAVYEEVRDTGMEGTSLA